jgi:hypothetical protein
MRSILLLALLVMPALALAEDPASTGHGFAAALAGPAFVTSASGGTHFTYGGRVGYRIGKSDQGEGMIGLAASTMTSSATASGVTSDARITFLGVEYVARQTFGTGLYFGGRAGVAFNAATFSSATSLTSVSDTVFAFAPVLGYEIRLTDRAHIVLDGSWLNIGGGTFQTKGSAVPYQSTSSLNVTAGLGLEF